MIAGTVLVALWGAYNLAAPAKSTLVTDISPSRPKITPTASPTLTPTPKAAPAKPPAIAAAPTSASKVVRSRFGIAAGDTLPGLSPSELARRMDDFKSLGLGWIRLDLDWNGIQGAGGNSYDWSRFDAVVSAANARGLSLIPILNATPPWARPANCSSSTCAPANPGQFGTFAHAAALRYASKGIHYWEIWNEENTAARWSPGPSPDAYVQLLKAAYPQIKTADPTSTVITGGLASTDTAGGNIPQLDFLAGVYSSGGRSYFDGVGYHPYSFPVVASNPIDWNAWSKMALTNPSLRSIMTANGDINKYIWATEYGAPSGGPGAVATLTNPNIDSPTDHVDEALQAAMAVDVVNTANREPWLAAVFWYSYKDLGTSSSSTENFYGLLRADGSKKPAYAAFRQAVLSSP